MVMGKEGPLLTCMVVEVLGAVWMVEVVPGRLVTVKAGFSVSYTQSKDGVVSLYQTLPLQETVWIDSPEWNQCACVQIPSPPFTCSLTLRQVIELLSFFL